MSRSEYSVNLDNWGLIRWRGAVAAATKGRRGQSFFKELLNALDNMPIKRLIADELEIDGQFCALGVLGKHRGIDMATIDTYESDRVAEAFDIAQALAKEVMFMNDEYCYCAEEPENRWLRMRQWVVTQIAT